jgi:hypothetical protein
MNLTLKNATLQAFWKSNRIDGTPEAILPSPLPRHYRTSTKRRVLVSRKGVTLSFIGGNAAQKSDAKHHESVLEPESHQKIYAFLSEKLNVPAYSMLARHLNFVIVRGSYREPSVIFNVDMMNGEIVRKLKLLSEQLKGLPDRWCRRISFKIRRARLILLSRSVRRCKCRSSGFTARSDCF